MRNSLIMPDRLQNLFASTGQSVGAVKAIAPSSTRNPAIAGQKENHSRAADEALLRRPLQQKNPAIAGQKENHSSGADEVLLRRPLQQKIPQLRDKKRITPVVPTKL
jgi:hypothetical protein